MNTLKPIRLNSSALASLPYFEAAARHLSFSRAAVELGVTSGAISHQVKYLEQSLRCKLFFRLPRQVKLTEEGAQLAEEVGRTLRQLVQTADQIANPGQSRLKVRLRAGPSFATKWLTPRLGRLHARNHDIRLHVIADYGYFDPADANFDIAIEFTSKPVSTLHTEPLMPEYLIPVCSPEYLTLHGPLETPADLDRCTLLHDRGAWEGASEDAEWRHWLDSVGAHEVDSQRGQFFSLSSLALEAAESHQGVAMGRLSLLAELLRTGRLVAPPLARRVECPTSYCLVYPVELATRPAVMEVTQWLREEASNEPIPAQAACA